MQINLPDVHFNYSQKSLESLFYIVGYENAGIYPAHGAKAEKKQEKTMMLFFLFIF